MLINSHCHVFNLQAIYTDKTKDIIRYKIESKGLSRAFANFALRVLDHYMKHGDGIDLGASLDDRVEALIAADERGDKKIAGALRAMSRGVDPDRFERFRKLLRLGTLDARIPDIEDLVDYLSVAFAKDMDQITTHLMNDLGDDWALVPLMMDITEGAGQEDEDLFKMQLESTVRQAERYPGRVFPFVAATTNRPGAPERVFQALGNGCVGVKLYPSLGYDLDVGMEIDEIFGHCNDNGVPMLMHCSRIGFKAGDGYERRCRPEMWWKLLRRYPKLRICFGHFGGDEDLSVRGEPGPWAGTIISMMRDADLGPRVFADLSYHTEAMKVGPQKRYFDRLAALLEEPACKGQILFGTDFWMVRNRLSDRSYVEYFRDNMSPEHFDIIARDNPRRFLGLRDSGPAENIMKQVRWLKKRRPGLDGSAMPEWLAKAW